MNIVESKPNIFVRIVERTPLLSRVVGVRSKGKQTVGGAGFDEKEGSENKKNGYVQEIFGEQKDYGAEMKRFKKEDPKKYQEIAKKKKKEERREENRWAGTGLVLALIVGGIIAGDRIGMWKGIHDWMINQQYAAQEGGVHKLLTGEHGPKTSEGIIDGCNLFNPEIKSRILSYYDKIEFTPEIEYTKFGLREFFDNIQFPSGWNELDVFLREASVNNWKSGYPQSTENCRVSLSAYKANQQEKQQSGLQNLKDYLTSHVNYSTEELQKLDRVIEKVYK